MSEQTTLQILKAARNKVADPLDWGQGPRLRRGRFQSCCAAEAIEEVVEASPERIRAYRAFANAAGIDVQRIPEWNDAPERTHKEVMAAFNLAIATVRLS